MCYGSQYFLGVGLEVAYMVVLLRYEYFHLVVWLVLLWCAVGMEGKVIVSKGEMRRILKEGGAGGKKCSSCGEFVNFVEHKTV